MIIDLRTLICPLILLLIGRYPPVVLTFSNLMKLAGKITELTDVTTAAIATQMSNLVLFSSLYIVNSLDCTSCVVCSVFLLF